MQMKHRVVVIDGMGGGIGAHIISRLKEIDDPEREIIALGTNATAAERMVKAGADRGAAGENAIRVSARLGDFIIGPIGIVIINSLMGELTAGMAEAVLSAPGERILLPLQNEHFFLAGAEPQPLAKQCERAIAHYRERITEKLKKITG
jgi:hypothetical protein